LKLSAMAHGAGWRFSPDVRTNRFDMGTNVESVSLLLGHSSIRTTEKYYCREDADLARLEVLRAFGESEKAPSFNTPLIDRRSDSTGYA